MPRPAWEETFGRERVELVVRESTCRRDALRRLGLRPAGGNFRTLAKYVALWRLDTSHFDPHHAARGRTAGAAPLEDLLVERSTYNRAHLKERLYREGVKERRCELCGQGEEWRGRHMALVLDHVNGVGDDNRLENLRIVCANCNATLPTHCGSQRKVRRRCDRCEGEYHPRRPEQRYCSVGCARLGQRRPRRVERPPEARLRAEIAASSYVAVGRAYGVSDNAVRKWLRAYERERAAASAPREPADTGRD